MENKINKIFCLAHGNCPDGFGALYAAFEHFGPAAEYVQVFHGKPFPENIPDGSEVYIMDFSYPKDVLLELNSRMSKLIVLDHHKSAMLDLQDLPFAHFDMSKSGAMLAWEYFHKKLVDVFPPPLLIHYVQDRDLWKNELKYSNEINAVITYEERDLYKWRNLSIELEENFDAVVNKGKAILSCIDFNVKMIAENMHYLNIDGYLVPSVNASCFFSDVVAYIREKHVDKEHPFSCYYQFKENNAVYFGLRCNEDFDVSIVAKKFGGGGHKQASGFSVPFEKFKEFIDYEKK